MVVVVVVFVVASFEALGRVALSLEIFGPNPDAFGSVTFGPDALPPNEMFGPVALSEEMFGPVALSLGILGPDTDTFSGSVALTVPPGPDILPLTVPPDPDADAFGGVAFGPDADTL
mmetsp:Transcript_81823/g.128868  ORF Transcript_81823/g.128868 Transcript_81823/m.128868 type:complete len:117 (-) Transcript_81823:819-1169(-)